MRSRFALGTLRICGLVRCGAIFFYAAYLPILRKRACAVLHVVVFIFGGIFHAVHCAVGSGLPRADSVDFTMCLEGPYFVYSVSR